MSSVALSIIASNWSQSVPTATVEAGDVVIVATNKRATGTATAPSTSISGGTATTNGLVSLDASRRYDTGGTSDGASRFWYVEVTGAGTITFSFSGSDSFCATVVVRADDSTALTVAQSAFRKREGGTSLTPTALVSRTEGSALMMACMGGGGATRPGQATYAAGTWNGYHDEVGVNGGYYKVAYWDTCNDSEILTPGTTTIASSDTLVNGGITIGLLEIGAR